MLKFYNKEEKDAIVITGVEGITDNIVKIPSVINGKSVKEIGPECFQNIKGIKSIEIPNTVVKIGKWAFGNCSDLQEMSIPDTVEVIGRNAFSYCTSLRCVHLPEELKEIGKSIFSGCSKLKDIVIPKSVTQIGWYAFVDCKSLDSIHIPDKIVEIGGAAFKGCTNLKTIHIPSKVKLIDWHAFEACKSLESIEVEDENENYSSIDGVLYDKSQQTLIYYPINKGESFEIPKKVKRIQENGFWGSINLKEIIIPESMQCIGDHAFNGSALVSIEMSDKVKIGQWAFSGSKDLEKVTITGDGKNGLNGLEPLRKGILNNKLQYFSGSSFAFDFLLSVDQKGQLALMYCKGQVKYNTISQKTYENYISSHIDDIILELIHEDSLEGLHYLARTNKIDPHKIDVFIEEANTSRSIKVLAFLMEYKNENVYNQDIDDPLSLD